MNVDMMQLLLQLGHLEASLVGTVRNLVKVWPEADTDKRRAIEATLLSILQIRQKSHVRVGLGTLIWKGDSVLLHRRGMLTHQGGVWASPGGHLEYGETWEECARREIAEECGPEIRYANLRYWHTVNTPYPEEHKHYITIFFTADWVSGEAQVMEPTKCVEWDWWRWDSLPHPLMLGNQKMFEAFPSRTSIDPARVMTIYIDKLREMGHLPKQMPGGNYVARTMGDYVMYGHCAWMCEQVIAGIVDGSKAHRWLGYVQGELRGLGLYSIDQLREHSRG